MISPLRRAEKRPYRHGIIAHMEDEKDITYEPEMEMPSGLPELIELIKQVNTAETVPTIS